MHIDIAKAWNIFVHNLPLFQYGIEMNLLVLLQDLSSAY